MTRRQILARLTVSGPVPKPSEVGALLLVPSRLEGRVVALRPLGFASGPRTRLDVQVRGLDGRGRREELGVRRVHHRHLVLQLGAHLGGWQVGQFVPMNRHGCMWTPWPIRPARD
ncbi:hypothetical protein [Streptomyces sp. NPDC056401]|uniref:hypothetical protein n=1 Tax=Streptomyces sp. NPDC056401 TaxID=3345809 RepID=UPI0035D76BBC